MNADFDDFLMLGMKEAKGGSLVTTQTIFKTFSNGVKTNRDDWVYDFSAEDLEQKVKRFIDTYNGEVDRWARHNSSKTSVDEFVRYNDKAIKWSRDLKLDLQRHKFASFEQSKIRHSLYRPFCKEFLFFDRVLNEEVYGFPSIFPNVNSEQENGTLCVSGIGSNKPFHALVTGIIPCLDLLEKTQCFPFYTYSEDGSDRRENITDWALGQFRARYGETVTKWDIFHYVYAVLHSPTYRQRYAENLKRDLPRIPLLPVEDWPGWVAAGEKLAKLHRDYETVTPYRLKRQETPGMALDWRIADKMRLSPDKRSLKYNDWLTLTDIPPRVFEYRLGNRSALEWVIDQYRVTTDARSGLTHDPNDPAHPDAIVRLVEQVVRVSLDTLDILDGLPPLNLEHSPQSTQS